MALKTILLYHIDLFYKLRYFFGAFKMIFGLWQRWARIRTGSDWIRTEANFGRIRTGL